MNIQLARRATMIAPVTFAALVACSSTPGPEAPRGDGRRVASCSFVDTLPSGHIRFTDARDVRGLDVACDSAALRAVTQRGEQISYQQTGGAPEMLLSPVKVGRAVALGKTDRAAVAELDLDVASPVLVTRDSNGHEVSRTSVDVPRLRWIEGDDWTFEDACFSRTGIPYVPGSGGPALELEIFPDQSAALLVRTCGYVDLIRLSPEGKQTGRETIFERSREGVKVLSPTPAVLDVDGETLFVAAAVPGAAEVTLSVNEPPASGKTRRQVSLSLADGNRATRALRMCGQEHLVIAGSRSRPIEGGENDSREDDVWVADIDPSNLTVRREATFDLDKDDHAFAIACDAAAGEIYLAGSTARHFVNTGSWDGGGKAFVLRLDMALEPLERIVMGNERLASARAIVLGRSKLVVSGVWDGVPNNHLPPDEHWSRAFIATLPRGNWSGVVPAVSAYESIADLAK